MTIVNRMSYLFAALAAFMIAGSAQAQVTPDILGENGDWTAFRFQESGNPVCFMASSPSDERGDYTQRGDVFAQVTHRPAENQTGVFSYIAGYVYGANSPVTATIDDDERFDFFTVDGHAFSQDSAMDDRLVAAMRAGLEMEVVGTSSRGTVTTDTVSLRGFTATYRLISEACGL